jgi:hypothetical protein
MKIEITCKGYGPPPRQPWRWLLVAWWTCRNWVRDLLRQS